MKSSVWIVDFGSQYTQLITRKFRELGYTSEIMTVEDAFEKLKAEKLFSEALNCYFFSA